jgi:hypothetical protein
MSANQQKTAQRQHGQHNHQMTLANPVRDQRQMIIPAGTIVPDKARKFRLPFPFLRTWIMSLLALIALPVGAMLIYVGMDFLDTLQPAWTEQSATVTSSSESGISYSWIVSGKAYSTTSGIDFTRMSADSPNGSLSVTLSICDLVAWWIIPTQAGATFPLWVNPQNPFEAQCVAMNDDTAGLMMLIGSILVLLSAIRLVRTISAAAVNSAHHP